jgi:hypothetical protein
MTTRKQPEADRKDWTFGQLLVRHMDRGTRPDGNPAKSGRRWTGMAVAQDCGVSDRAVRAWRNDEYPPDDIETLERMLFGDGDAYAEWKNELREAWSDARRRREHSVGPGPSPAAGIELPGLPGPVPPSEPPQVPQPERCVGRAADSARLVAALRAGSAPTAVLVQGSGGIGKTTLTQDVANHADVLARFGPRRWFVALETATDRDTFDPALLTAIGLDPTAGFAAAPRRLAQAPTLLVLDNLETPWEHAGPAIEARLGELAAIPGVALLASFRGQEAVGGVRWSLRYRVDPLPDDEARALFLDIADAVPADDPHLPELLRALGGVPLAICLTARRAARHSELKGLWAEWQRVGVEMARWQGAEPSRLTSVAHSIELSLRSPRLGASGRRLFAVLGQVPAGLAATDRDTLLGDEAFAAEDGLLAVGLAYPPRRAARSATAGA